MQPLRLLIATNKTEKVSIPALADSITARKEKNRNRKGEAKFIMYSLFCSCVFVGDT